MLYTNHKKGVFAVAVEFYDVKTRQKVQIDDSKVKRVTFKTKKGGIRYGLRAQTADGRKLTKFVSKADWDSMRYPVEG
jgi:hypothetical protein